MHASVHKYVCIWIRNTLSIEAWWEGSWSDWLRDSRSSSNSFNSTSIALSLSLYLSLSPAVISLWLRSLSDSFPCLRFLLWDFVKSKSNGDSFSLSEVLNFFLLLFCFFWSFSFWLVFVGLYSGPIYSYPG